MKVQSAARSWAFGIMAFLAIMVGIYALAMYAIPSHIQEAPLVKGKGELPTLWYPVLWAHAMSCDKAFFIFLYFSLDYYPIDGLSSPDICTELPNFVHI